MAQVGESDISSISRGDQVTVSFPAITGSTVDGRVTAVEPQSVNIEGRVYFLVTISLDSTPEGAFLPAGSSADGTAASLPLVGLTANVSF